MSVWQERVRQIIVLKSESEQGRCRVSMMLRLGSLTFRFVVFYFAMSAWDISRYEAVFLCLHPEEPKISYRATVKYMKKSKALVSKWVQRYSDVKNVYDQADCGSAQTATKIWTMIYYGLLLRVDKHFYVKKRLKKTFTTSWWEISKHKEETVRVRKTSTKMTWFCKRKSRMLVGQCDFFYQTCLVYSR